MNKNNKNKTNKNKNNKNKKSKNKNNKNKKSKNNNNFKIIDFYLLKTNLIVLQIRLLIIIK